MISFRKISVALCMTSLSSFSFAQSTAPTTAPDTVGVEQREAREAMERAQRRDAEASVIRTDQTAEQEVRDAAGAVRDGAAAMGNRASDAAERDTGATGRGTAAAGRDSGAAGRDAASEEGQFARAPRADRN